MQPAVTDTSANEFFERLLARRNGDEIPAVELARYGKEMATALRPELEASVVHGVKLNFAGHERLDSDAWTRALAPNAGLIAISGGKDSDLAAVLLSVDYTAVTSLAAGALGGNPAVGSSIGDRALTAFETDFLPLLGRSISGPLGELLPPGLTQVSGMPAGALDPATVPSVEVIVLKYEVGFGEATGTMAMAIPETYLKAHRARKKEHADGSGADPFSTSLWSSRLRVQATIALPALTLGKLKNLSAGDLVPIPVENFDRGTLSTRGKDIFTVQIGHLDDAFSFRVLHPVRKASGFLNRVAESLSRAGQTKI